MEVISSQEMSSKRNLSSEEGKGVVWGNGWGVGSVGGDISFAAPGQGQ